MERMEALQRGSSARAAHAGSAGLAWRQRGRHLEALVARLSLTEGGLL